jgi:putative transcriptional regulator
LVLFLLSASVVMPQTAPQAALAPGRFLVASAQLRDPGFARTVVLLLDYGERGARGVIINRQTDVKLAAVFPRISGLHQRPDTVYLGGPVARNQLLILLRSDRPRANTEHVVDDIYVSTSRRVLVDALNRAGSAASVHVYAGYAGWVPGQLDREVARGDWHVVPADAEAVFSKTPGEVWRELIDKGAVQWL